MGKRPIATIAICLSIALVAIGVRLLLWQDNRTVFPRVFTGMVDHHKANVRVLLSGDVTHFITGPEPPGDANILTYPPGYPILMASIFRLFGETDSAMRIFQILCDAVAAVLLFFLAAEFLPRKAAILAAMLAALSPQLAYYSLLLVPDSLATLPILLALYFLVRAIKHQSIGKVIAAGACVGLSCWLRSNALLLAPLLAVVLFFVLDRTRRWKFAGVLVGATVLVIAPITIRNAIVFQHFIPLSLGAGQMLNVGIGDYDRERRFGLPGTDLETVTSEAQAYGRPDYASSLFGSDGVERDKRRVSRGLSVIGAHPLWFGSVVLRRAVSMLRLERVRVVSAAPAPTHSLDVSQLSPVWSRDPAELMPAQPGTNGSFQIHSAPDRAQTTIASFSVPVDRNSDYLFRLPVKVDRGNLVISILNQGKVLAMSPVLHPLEASPIVEAPTFLVEVPFVNREANEVLVVLTNEGKRPVETVAQAGKLELFRLGGKSLGWAEYVRIVIHAVQSLYLTALIIPFAALGLVILLAAGQGRSLLILMAVPVYYFCTQSVLHTEYRYVMAIQDSLFVMVAAALYWLTTIATRQLKTRSKARAR